MLFFFLQLLESMQVESHQAFYGRNVMVNKRERFLSHLKSKYQMHYKTHANPINVQVCHTETAEKVGTSYAAASVHSQSITRFLLVSLTVNKQVHT